MAHESKLTWRGRIFAAAIGIIILMVVCEIGLRLAMPHWREFYSGRFLHPTIVEGFGIVTIGKPGFDDYFSQNNGDFRVRVTINSAGLRNRELIEKSDGRLWVIGDSMSFGWGVEAEEMYSSVIGTLLDRNTYNIASPGTDVCGYRSLLARMPKEVHPGAVIIGLILENDIRDYECSKQWARQEREARPLEDQGDWPFRLNDLKRFLTGYTATYNFLAVALKRIPAATWLFSKLGIIQDVREYKNPVNGLTIESATAATAEELSKLRRMLPKGTPFLVLVVPGRFELANDDALYRNLRTEMKNALSAQDIRHIDLYEPFSRAGFRPTHFAHDGHWSPLGHEVAAKAAADWLRNHLQ